MIKSLVETGTAQDLIPQILKAKNLIESKTPYLVP